MEQSPIILIPGFREFANLLHERLHTVLFHIEEIETKFTLTTILSDKSPIILKDNKEVYRYVGVETQRKILENSNYNSKGEYISEEAKKASSKNWKFLDENSIKEGTETEKVTVNLVDEFKEGKLSLKDIRVGYLREYFIKIDNPFKENEYSILNTYFDISTDAYILIPIIAFGRIEGVVNIVFSEKEVKRFENTKTILCIVKLFIREYEDMLLDWQVTTGDNMENRLIINY